MTKNNIFAQFLTCIMLALAVLIPLFFLPFTNDLFDTNKRFLFVGTALLAVLLSGIYTMIKKEVRLTRTPWTIPVALFGVSTFVSILFVSQNKVAAFLGMGGMYLAFSALFIAATSLIRKNFTNSLIGALSFAGLIVTFTSIVDRFGFNIINSLNNSFNLALPTDAHFFITGSPLFSVFFLGLVALMLGVRLLQKKQDASKRVMSIVFTVACVIGILVNGESLLPGRATQPRFLSLLDSWSVTTDVLKTPVNAAFGVGTDSYQNAYSIFKPARANQSPLWFVRFGNARNSVLELLTTHGIFGVFAWIFILLTTLRLIKTAQDEQLALGVGSLALELILLFFPPNILMIGLLCVFLVAWSVSLKEKGIHTMESAISLFAYADLIQSPALTRVTKGQPLFARGFAILLLLVSLVGFYGLSRAYMGEYWFNRSLVAAQKGQGKETYDAAVKAILANPFMENYHRTFAVTNLSLAQAISQNKEPSDADKQNVITLVQQAIAQAKIATTLDPVNTANWDALTNIYQSLVGSADGAIQWTVASYIEQIKTDPGNPQLRFNLGSFYRSQGNDDLALKLFDQSTQLKPDYANSYFNMADIYKKRGDKQNELVSLQTTLTLIKPEQEGYSGVKARYDELVADLTREQQEAQQKTQTPVATPKPTATPTPTPKVEQVTLPENAGLDTNTQVPEVPQQ